MQSAYYNRYYAKAQNIRGQMRQSYDDLLESCDVLVLPTTAILPTPIPDNDAPLRERMVRTLDMIHNTCRSDLTGHPAISVPCGVADDLPVGFMIVGRHFEDATVLQVAAALEAAADWESC